MISYRQADLLESLQDFETPPVKVDFVITFPTANNGNEHAKKNGVYYAVPSISIDLIAPDTKNEAIIDKIESITPSNFESDGDWYIYANPGEYFDDFSKRIRNEYIEKLSKISESPPTYSTQTTDRHQLIIHLMVKPTKKL